MRPGGEELTGHPDRQRWNARYSGGFTPSFLPHPLAVRALSMRLPAGPVADLACGPSGSALLAAGSGRQVTAVDVSEVALAQLAGEAQRQGVAELITLVHADLGSWRPQAGGYALVLCTGYWDAALFPAAADAVRLGGMLGWESFTTEAQRDRPRLCAGWCLRPGEPASLLPAGFQVLSQMDLAGRGRGARRRLLARRWPERMLAPGNASGESAPVAVGFSRGRRSRGPLRSTAWLRSPTGTRRSSRSSGPMTGRSAGSSKVPRCCFCTP